MKAVNETMCQLAMLSIRAVLILEQAIVWVLLQVKLALYRW
jgi:hypothetical protein